jgi:hypothetical protein
MGCDASESARRIIHPLVADDRLLQMTELCAADPPILDLLHLQAGAVVGVAVEKGPW